MPRGRRIIQAGSALCLVVTVAACDPGPDPSAADLDAPSFRRGCEGKWIGNGLLDPDVGDVSPAHGLDTAQGLDPAGALLSDPAGLQVAQYLVECALPEGDAITKLVDGQLHELPGALGLAPQWRDGPCDEGCQEWVSACLLARTNASGETVGLWLAADHPAIGLGHGPDEPIYEATFYGNLFAEPEARYVCRGPQAAGGQLGAWLQGRTCGGLPLEDCGFTDLGGCADDDRCGFDNGFAVECADGDDPTLGTPHHSISTFVSLEGWQGG